MGKSYEIRTDYFREKIMAAVLVGYRTVKEPVAITAHPDLMARIRKEFSDKSVAPKKIGDEEYFFGLPVIEDPSGDKEHISVS
ncbi:MULTISPECIES: hypothetical protein [Prosthecochloris]|uniref:Uncharacterized protein n=1 Tax=Prosthecochloris vibrioformis TaxID=1098 RepID=A0A5C4S2P4_PROVB|nr:MULTISPECIES: hypothetical protein [Prosthecochloris]TNJ37021.1 hypothetical protein FGF68_05460 [Prosthecochloris vibrioformis]